MTSRPPPPVVPPIHDQGITYRQDDESQRHGGDQPGGYLVAIDQVSGRRLWMLKVYHIEPTPPGLSHPGRYFRSMRLDAGRLLIEDECGGRHVVDLATRTATTLPEAGTTRPAAIAVPPKPPVKQPARP